MIVPFLPGDSVLVAVGVISRTQGSNLDPWLAAAVLCAAAIIGDSTNYWVGRWLGPRVFASETSRLLNRTHLMKAQGFYAKHGGKTVIFCRFLAVIRTFAPFVAGVGAMKYPRFRSSRYIIASNTSISGRPTFSDCLTRIGNQSPANMLF